MFLEIHVNSGKNEQQMSQILRMTVLFPIILVLKEWSENQSKKKRKRFVHGCNNSMTDQKMINIKTFDRSKNSFDK